MIFEYTNRESKSLQHLLVVRLIISIKRTMQYKKKKKKRIIKLQKIKIISIMIEKMIEILHKREKERKDDHVKRFESKFVGTRRNSGCWIGELICYLSV